MRRIALAAALTCLAAVPAAASAQAPVTPGQQPPAQLQPAKISLAVAGPRKGRRTYAVALARVRVTGSMNAAAAGDTVTVDLFRSGRRRARTHAKVGRRGHFVVVVRPRSSGGFTVRATHRAGAAVAVGKSRRAGFVAVRGNWRTGSRGPVVRLIQQQLARLGYVTSRGGRYDDATARAVLAYRKVNRLSRVGSVNRTVLASLFAGQGGFRLRYPRAGKHVEADLSRQVLVLANHGRVERIYTTSSGKPSTPTVVGSFRFYRKDPGYNSEAMYYSNYFIRGYAIHGYHDVPAYNASHGCLRVPLANAVSIYRWISLGDRIFVYQRGRGSTRVRGNAGP